MPIVKILYDREKDENDPQGRWIPRLTDVVRSAVVEALSVPGSVTAVLPYHEVIVLPRPYQQDDLYDPDLVLFRVEANDYVERHAKFENAEVRIAEFIRDWCIVPIGLKIGVWVISLSGGRYVEIPT